MNSILTSTAGFLPTRESRRQAAPFSPITGISVRTGIWSVLLGIGLITPLAVGLGSLHLPASAQTAALLQRLSMARFSHPGALFLQAVVIYPIIEEVLYRGLVLQLLRRYCPLWFAIGFSSFFFAVTHLGQGATNALNAFLLGGVFAWLVVRSRSLIPSMLCHAAVNFSWLFLIQPAFGVLEKFFNLDLSRPLPTINPLSVFPAWWLATSVALVITAGVMLRKSFSRPTAV